MYFNENNSDIIQFNVFEKHILIWIIKLDIEQLNMLKVHPESVPSC